MSYPNGPGFVRGSDTSEQASRSVAVKAADMRKQILQMLASRGLHGATSREAGEWLGIKPQTISARFAEMSQRGEIGRTPRKRATQGGCKAYVYVLPSLISPIMLQEPTLERLARVNKRMNELRAERNQLLTTLERGWNE
tara:strand:- start:373 stop:792 length:420 start_codon:yes stop_codon:yes gene_type:complete